MMRVRTQRTSQSVIASEATAIDSNATDAPSASSSTPKAVSKRKTIKTNKSKSRSKAAATKRASQQGADTEKISNRKRRLASLFISFLASSPMAFEDDATNEETIEAAKKASIAPKVHRKSQPSKSHKRKVSVIRTVEIRPSRWKRFQHGMKLNPKGKTSKKGGWTEFEMDDVQTLKG